jgi:microcin C transport system substrate-binding protein
VPNYYVDTWRVAYWKRFGRPEVTPQSEFGLATWWEEQPLTAIKPPPAAPEQEAE